MKNLKKSSKMNSPKVNSIEMSDVKKALKDTPQVVKDYISALEDLYAKQGILLIKCKEKLRNGE